MIRLPNLFRMMAEIIFIFLGGFLVWIGLSRGFWFDPRKPAWLALGTVLVYWGIRGWLRTSRLARTAERAAARVGGASLALVGLIMLGLGFVEFRWIGTVLAAAGGILILRGVVGVALSFWMG